MKKSVLLLTLAMTAGMLQAKTLRVNNSESNGAPYTTAADAITAAEDGDVIILEASTKDYGDFTVNKNVTIQGSGYFLDVNKASKEGAASSAVGTVTVTAENAKLTGLEAWKFTICANNVIVNRCAVRFIEIGKNYSFSDTSISGCIIHQNFILQSISSDSYSGYPENIQITNNLFSACDNDKIIWQLRNSVISRNTFAYFSSMWSKIARIDNCVIENNIGGGVIFAGDTNTYQNNFCDAEYDAFNNNRNDKLMQEAELSLGVDAGAFSGEDPYVLSGLPSSPRVVDLTVPASVEQGQDLNVTVKIARAQ